MTFDWCEYYTLARDLHAQAANANNGEALLRSSLSRAYYAAFHVARRDLQARGDYTPAEDDNPHAYVCNAYRRDPDHERRKVGEDLLRLRVDRNEADYEDVISGLQAMASSALILVQKILTSLEYPQQP